VGTFPGRADPLATGMVGMHGTMASNMALQNCDLLLVLGARFSDRVTGDASSFAAHAKVIQIDIDASEINKNVPTDLHVIQDLKVALTCINAAVPGKKHPEWVKRIAEWKAETNRTSPAAISPAASCRSWAARSTRTRSS
jgi:Thiamine pyrophosphate-requiring enzymes [acetolactate synthase, pyruvate dehydrogenase (cytochrome), glyoxylate carboligase, phosphonopyruvate decarboxylase]